MGSEIVPLLMLLIMWLAYFALHSLLADPPVRQALSAYSPALGRRYRLFFNGLACVLLLPPLILLHGEPWTPLWDFAGPWAWLADGLAALALLGFFLSARQYDLRGFLGVAARSTTETLRISSWHRHVRHPWYALALVLIWTRPMNSGFLLTALALTAYFVIGSRLEERKLCVQFGKAYAAYQARVPALLPWPGRSLSAAEAAALEAAACAEAGSPQVE